MQFGPTGTFLPRSAGAFAPLPCARWRTRLCRIARWQRKVVRPEDKTDAKILDSEGAVEDVTFTLMTGTGLSPFSTGFGCGPWPLEEEP